MTTEAPVDQKRLVVVSTKVPEKWSKLLEAAAVERGESFKSETMRSLIRTELERLYPGATTREVA